MSTIKTLCCTLLLSSMIFGSGPVDAGFGLFKRCRAKSACRKCCPVRTVWTCKAYLYACNENGCPCPVEVGEGAGTKEHLAQTAAVVRAFVKLPPDCTVVRTVAVFVKTTTYCCGSTVTRCYKRTYCGLPPILAAHGPSVVRLPKGTVWQCTTYIDSEENDGYPCSLAYGEGEDPDKNKAIAKAIADALSQACPVVNYIDPPTCITTVIAPGEPAKPMPVVPEKPAASKEEAKQ